LSLSPFGVFSLLLVAWIGQRELIKVAAHDLNYRFIAYVFSGAEFPWSYLDQGRVIRRAFFPVKITTTYYNERYEEVTRADRPGR
jgi:hypothetical protein